MANNELLAGRSDDSPVVKLMRAIVGKSKGIRERELATSGGDVEDIGARIAAEDAVVDVERAHAEGEGLSDNGAGRSSNPEMGHRANLVQRYAHVSVAGAVLIGHGKIKN